MRSMKGKYNIEWCFGLMGAWFGIALLVYTSWANHHLSFWWFLLKFAGITWIGGCSGLIILGGIVYFIMQTYNNYIAEFFKK